MSTLMRNIFLSFAQFERDMIVERTQEGKAIARQNPDFREGRPHKYSKTQINHAREGIRQLYTELYKEKNITKFRNTKISIERKVAA